MTVEHIARSVKHPDSIAAWRAGHAIDNSPLVETMDGKRVIYFEKREKETIVDVVNGGYVQSRAFVNGPKVNEKTLVDYILVTGTGLTHRAIEAEAGIPDSATPFVDRFMQFRTKLGNFTGDRDALFITHGPHNLQTYTLNAYAIPRSEPYVTSEEPEQEPDPAQPTYYVRIGKNRTEVVVPDNGAINTWIFNNTPNASYKSIADYYFTNHLRHTSQEQLEAAVEAADQESARYIRRVLKKLSGGKTVFDSSNRQKQSMHRFTGNIVLGPPPDNLSLPIPLPEAARQPVEYVDSIDGKRVFYFERTEDVTTVKVLRGEKVHVAHFQDDDTMRAKSIVDFMLDNPYFIDMVELADVAAIPDVAANVPDQISKIRRSLDTMTGDQESVFTKHGATREKSYKMNAVVIDLDPSDKEPAEDTPVSERNPDWPTYYVRQRENATYVTVVTNGKAETDKFVNSRLTRRKDMADYILPHPGEPLAKAQIAETLGDQSDSLRANLVTLRLDFNCLNNRVAVFAVKHAGLHSEFTFQANVVYGKPPAELFDEVRPKGEAAQTVQTSNAETEVKAHPFKVIGISPRRNAVIMDTLTGASMEISQEAAAVITKIPVGPQNTKPLSEYVEEVVTDSSQQTASSVLSEVRQTLGMFHRKIRYTRNRLMVMYPYFPDGVDTKTAAENILLGRARLTSRPEAEEIIFMTKDMPASDLIPAEPDPPREIELKPGSVITNKDLALLMDRAALKMRSNAGSELKLPVQEPDDVELDLDPAAWDAEIDRILNEEGYQS